MIKGNGLDDVGLLGAIVCNDTCANKLIGCSLLEFLDEVIALNSVVDFIIELLNSVQNSFGRHESATIVNDQSAAGLVFVRRYFESVPD